MNGKNEGYEEDRLGKLVILLNLQSIQLYIVYQQEGEREITTFFFL